MKFHGIPEHWTPKFGEGANELQEAWWGSKHKRTLMKKRTRSAMGKYFQEGMVKGALGMGEEAGTMYGEPFKGKRKAYKKYYPTYDVTSLNVVQDRLPMPSGYGLDYSVGRYRQIAKPRKGFEKEYEALRNFQKSTSTDVKVLEGLLDQVGDVYPIVDYEWIADFQKAFGGLRRGYGGAGNIMRSAGDIGYNIFSLDIRMAVHLLGAGNQNMLAGLAGNIGGEATNVRGLNRRIGTGEHPGTTARYFVRNTAERMRTWLRNVLKEGSRDILKGRGVSVVSRKLR